MPRVRTRTALRRVETTSRIPQAVVISEGAGHLLDEALETVGMTETLAQLRSAQPGGLAVAIAADRAMPRGLLAYLHRHGAARISIIPLTPQPIVPEEGGCVAADPTCQTAASSDLALSTSWATNDVRIVVSRVKTDRRGAYSLCGAALKACLSRGDLGALLERYPAHCSIVTDPLRDTPAVVSDHPLLADWVGATLMGRDPHSAPANADWYRRGLLPRVYRVHGETRPVRSWRDPPSLQHDLPHAVCGDPVVRCRGQGAADAAAAWVACSKSVLEPFLPPRLGAQGEASTRELLFERIGAAVSSESLGELLEALLKGLALLIALHPVLRDEIRALRASYRLTTQDRRMNVVARFSGGVLTASRADSGPVNVALVLKDTSALLRLLAAPKPDLLRALLKQQVTFEGNLNYLLKLGYLLRRATVIVRGDLRMTA